MPKGNTIKQQYSIDFVYTDTGHQFSTGAMLTVKEKSALETHLISLKDAGSISDPQVYQPIDVKQSYRSVLKEIKAALKS